MNTLVAKLNEVTDNGYIAFDAINRMHELIECLSVDGNGKLIVYTPFGYEKFGRNKYERIVRKAHREIMKLVAEEGTEYGKGSGKLIWFDTKNKSLYVL